MAKSVALSTVNDIQLLTVPSKYGPYASPARKLAKDAACAAAWPTDRRMALSSMLIAAAIGVPTYFAGIEIESFPGGYLAALFLCLSAIVMIASAIFFLYSLCNYCEARSNLKSASVNDVARAKAYVRLIADAENFNAHLTLLHRLAQKAPRDTVIPATVPNRLTKERTRLHALHGGFELLEVAREYAAQTAVGFDDEKGFTEDLSERVFAAVTVREAEEAPLTTEERIVAEHDRQRMLELEQEFDAAGISVRARV